MRMVDTFKTFRVGEKVEECLLERDLFDVHVYSR